MNIICLVKFVLVTESNKTGSLRKIKKRIANPEDEYALELALQYKDLNPKTNIEVISMGSKVVIEPAKDLIRKGVSKVTILCDDKFKGSDTYATSLILSKYIEGCGFDLILSGNKSIDADTGQVGPQLATRLGITQYSHVTNVQIEADKVLFEMDLGQCKVEIEQFTPLLLSCNKQVVKRPRFVKLQNQNKEVDSCIEILSNNDLKCDENTIGLHGSPTIVKSVKEIHNIKKKTEILESEAGIELIVEKIKEVSNGSFNNN